MLLLQQKVLQTIGDKAPLNFCKNQSVMTKIHNLNSNILPNECNCHVIHNRIQNACKILKYYLETILVKVYEFIIQTKLNKALKEFYE
jgi:hypothetical protein